MCIKFEAIYEWSREIVEFINEHQDAYNIQGELTVNSLVPTEIELYNIIYDNELIGFFIIEYERKQDKLCNPEIEIGIFNIPNRKKHIGRDVIRYFIQKVALDKFNNGKRIYATVQGNNPLKNHIEKMLFENNFQLDKQENTTKNSEKIFKPNRNEQTEDERKKEEEILKLLEVAQSINPYINKTYYIDIQPRS